MNDKNGYFSGYLQAVEEIGAAQEEQAIFEEDFEKFKSFLFVKGEVRRGRWWVGAMTYQQAVEVRMGRFAFAPGRI